VRSTVPVGGGRSPLAFGAETLARHMNSQQNESTARSANPPKPTQRLALLIGIACVLGVFALAWPRVRDWQSHRTLISQLTVRLAEVEKLATTTLENTEFVRGPGSRLTESVSGWYKITQQRLDLSRERAFLRQRVAGLDATRIVANSLPDAENGPLTEALRRCQTKWRSVVPSEITDDENCNWEKLATQVNEALMGFAKEVRELPYIK